MTEGSSTPETPIIEKPPVTLTEIGVASPTEALNRKQDGIKKVLWEVRNGWEKILKEVTGKSTPETKVIANPPVTPTEIPVKPGVETVTGTATLPNTTSRIEGKSTPETQVVNSPAVTPTEIPVKPGVETVTGTATTAPQPAPAPPIFK